MPDPLVIQIVDEFRGDLGALNEGAVAAMVQNWRTVEESLFEEIGALVETMGEPPTVGQLWQNERFVRLLAQVQEQISGYNEAVTPGLNEVIYAAIRQGMSDSVNFLDLAAQAQDVILGSYSTLDVGAIESLAALARAGQPLGEILNRAYPIGAQGIADELLKGLAMGLNPREITRRIMSQGLSQSLNHILLVTRDQVNRAYRTATIEQYKESGLVRGYYRVASKSVRTCPGCLALDGKFFPLDVPFAEHPQGRCVAIPGLKRGKPLQFETGRQWFVKQPKAVQVGILGPGRWTAWNKGLFDFDDLATIKENAVWGPAVQPTALKDLVDDGDV